MTTTINDKLTQYRGKTGLCYQITLPHNKNNPDNNANGLGGYGHCWITITKEQMDNIVLDYIKHKFKREEMLSEK